MRNLQRFSGVLYTLLFSLFFFFVFTLASAQSPDSPIEDGVEEARIGSSGCPADPCPCFGGFKQMEIYYFGEDNVDIDVYSSSNLTELVVSFSGVNSGDLLTIDGTGLPFGRLNARTFFKVTNAVGDVCVTRIFSQCATNSWPGALDDRNPLGKTYGDFVVFSHTDMQDSECSLADSGANQDWHVGGNVVAAPNNTMGSRNVEDVTFITGDVPRAVITKTGNVGIGTQTPAARLDVAGDAIVQGELDVNGDARMNSGTAATSPTSGALVVTGGTGISGDLHVGGDGQIHDNLNVGNNADVTNDLTVGNNANVTNILSVGSDASVGGNLDVTGSGAIGTDLAVGNDANIGHTLFVTEDALVGNNMVTANNADVGNNLTVLNTIFSNLIQANAGDLAIESPGGTDIIINGNASDGKVAIGTTSIPLNVMGTDVSAYKLFVKGGILTEEMRVRTDWADYVFRKDHKLPTLSEVKAYIDHFGHLPDMPSAEEVETQGLELGENAKNQQAKIEEIYLYLFQMEERIKTLEEENARLKTLLEK